jgi:hypothetical protein
MRWLEIINEAPIADFGTEGNLDRYGSFRDSDLKAIRNPKWVEKVHSAFSKTPYDFNIYVHNRAYGMVEIDGKAYDLRNLEHYAAGKVGNQPWSVVADFFQKPANAASAITCLLLENEGDEQFAFTPWILAHRCAHAAVINNIQPATDSMNPARDLQEDFFADYRSFIELMDMKFSFNDYPDYEPRQNFTSQVSAIAKIVGKTRAMRTGNLANPGEFVIEMLTQYLIQGKITFNRPIMDNIGFRNRPLIDAKDHKFYDLILDKYGWGINHDTDNTILQIARILVPKPKSRIIPQFLVVDKDGEIFASMSDEKRAAEYRAKGYTVQEKYPSRQAMTAHAKYQAEIKRVIEMMHYWVEEGLFAKATATEDAAKFLDLAETNFNRMAKKIFDNCVGKLLIL